VVGGVISLCKFREEGDPRLSGFVDWSLSDFNVNKLLDGKAFPAFSAHELQVYDMDGEVIEGESAGDTTFAAYVPYVDFNCLMDRASDRDAANLENALTHFNNTAAISGLQGTGEVTVYVGCLFEGGREGGRGREGRGGRRGRGRGREGGREGGGGWRGGRWREGEGREGEREGEREGGRNLPGILRGSVWGGQWYVRKMLVPAYPFAQEQHLLHYVISRLSELLRGERQSNL
jgi:hypothetical protein